MANEEPEDLNLEVEPDAATAGKAPSGKIDKSKIILLGICVLVSIILTTSTFFIIRKLQPIPVPVVTPPPLTDEQLKAKEIEDKKAAKKKNKAKPKEGGEGGEGAGAVDDPDAIGYLPITPPFIVNFQTQLYVPGPKFLQVEIVLMSHNHDLLSEVQNNLPILKNALVGLLSSKTLVQLNTPEAKETLRKEALELVKSTLKNNGLDSDIEDVLFDSFVMQ